MKIGIVGLGYVGLVTAAVLADQGHYVAGVDIDENKVKGLNCNRLPIYEPGLDELIAKNRDRLHFTNRYDEVSEVELAFITVSTPTINGRINLDYVFLAAKSLRIIPKDSVIVVKSTVVPGTSRKVREISEREVVSNPEFLKEGSAIQDTLKPDRIVIGSESKEAGDLVEELWRFTGSPIFRTTLEEAEMIKYAANSFLALKISFINEIANLCEKLPGCDAKVVAKVIGMDKRISPYFLDLGLGWGGSCFPKDTQAFVSFAKDMGERLRTVEAAIEVNSERAVRAVNLLKGLMGSLMGRRVCVLGVAFKPNTDDTRESMAIKVIKKLLEEGAVVMAYDPKARTDLVNMLPSKEECIREAEGVVVATEWGEFYGIEDLLKNKYVVDGRRVLRKELMDGRYFRAIGLGY
ncbi:UDP-glucose 6-dehydrogenase [Saccharolobus shibatae B12]|uniref:UDP-glucose 6-dehydrogenase n=1 Tax=Saccharolobus shibatae (strain ATCC 51178 / DSM 5389 / JCM 8931 / NBRC 15437 / B12) TaxID=523848 RepID=A0A8F5GTP3_SACSH|nr:UDP-glucose/GDP-mannose dehydrogenase family protein [Saccharolobus shibatae]QXJ28577.1 UDP-glucose 6-dehydrogenase [Saccharolobus shibatae B12]